MGPTRTTAANTNVTLYTVPAGHTLVMRSISAFFSGFAGHAYLQVNPAAAGATAPILRLDSTAELVATHEQWMAFRPGDVLLWQASAADCYATLFGALLDGAGPL